VPGGRLSGWDCCFSRRHARNVGAWADVSVAFSGPRGSVGRGPPGEVGGLRDFSQSDRGRQAPARPRASVAACTAALASGATATLAAMAVAGPGALLDWLGYVGNRRPDGYWANNTLPGAAARLFRDNNFVEPIAILPWLEPVAYVLGVGIVILTAFKARLDGDQDGRTARRGGSLRGGHAGLGPRPERPLAGEGRSPSAALAPIGGRYGVDLGFTILFCSEAY
jgi:hypothetical protein